MGIRKGTPSNQRPFRECRFNRGHGSQPKLYDPREHHVISNASCTTSSLAPAVRVLNDAFGIEYLMVTTVHVCTASQALVNRAARKLRRGRAAAASLIPTSTGAAEATALVMPELKDRMDAIAVRAPIPDGCKAKTALALSTSCSSSSLINGQLE